MPAPLVAAPDSERDAEVDALQQELDERCFCDLSLLDTSSTSGGLARPAKVLARRVENCFNEPRTGVARRQFVAVREGTDRRVVVRCALCCAAPGAGAAETAPGLALASTRICLLYTSPSPRAS